MEYRLNPLPTVCNVHLEFEHASSFRFEILLISGFVRHLEHWRPSWKRDFKPTTPVFCKRRPLLSSQFPFLDIELVLAYSNQLHVLQTITNSVFTKGRVFFQLNVLAWVLSGSHQNPSTTGNAQLNKILEKIKKKNIVALVQTTVCFLFCTNENMFYCSEYILLWSTRLMENRIHPYSRVLKIY